MTVKLSPVAGAAQQFFDDSGVPLSGGKLYAYAAGTTTPQTTYTSVAGNVPHTNPIILNSSGRIPTGEVWLTFGQTYKFVLKTSTEILIATWDNISGINDWTGISILASQVSFTGFNGQVGTVDDLADDDGSDWVGFIPAALTGVARSAQNKMRDVVSVKDFGAVGSGAVNDQPAIQAAINAVQALGRGAIYFPSGNYRIDSRLDITANDIMLYGDGILSSTIFSNSDNFQLIRFSNSIRSSMYDLGVYRNRMTTTTTDFTLWLDNCVQFSAKRLLLQGSYYNLAITGTASADSTFQECILNFATGPAMLYTARSGAGINGAYHFYRCLFNQSYPGGVPVPSNYKGSRANSTAYAVSDVILVGTYYYQCTSAGTSAASQPPQYGTVWYLTGITDGTAVFKLMAPQTYSSALIDTGVTYVNFRECDFTVCADFGITTTNNFGGDKPNNLHVEQCTFHGNIVGGINVVSGEEFDLKSLEVLYPTGPATHYGILCDVGSSDINITNLSAHAVKGDAVFIGGPGVNVSASTITGNTVGVRVAANVNKFRIIGNNLGSDARWGANVNAVIVEPGTSNNYIISQNIVAGASSGVTDGGTGLSKSVTANV